MRRRGGTLAEVPPPPRPAADVDAAWPAWRRRLHEIIFEADTRAGLAFDVGLLVVILASVAVVMLASIEDVRAQYGEALYVAEWLFTAVFTVEYALRLIAVRRPLAYARSFFGVVDLLALLPTWLGLVLAGSESLMVVRLLRMLRVFRIFKLSPFLVESNVLLLALQRSQRKVLVFLFTVLVLVTVLGAVMFVVEGPEAGYTSIPVAIYWAIVTVTTVGYGDISPTTPLGQMIASLAMILGYAIIAVPTGIVSVGLAEVSRRPPTAQACPSCSREGHDVDAVWCKFCGGRL